MKIEYNGKQFGKIKELLYELKEKYTVKEALQFLKSKNAYRVEMFEEFFNKK